MKQGNTELATLRKILWIDFLLGFVAGITGILFIKFLADLMNIPASHILVISSVTTSYSAYAFYLTQQRTISFPSVRLLVNANWFWAVISLGFLIHHVHRVTGFGLAYLVLQVLVVAALAFWESRQLRLVFPGATT